MKGGAEYAPPQSLGSRADFQTRHERVLQDHGGGPQLPADSAALGERVAGSGLRVDDHRRHGRLALQRDDAEGIATEEQDRVDIDLVASACVRVTEGGSRGCRDTRTGER